MNNTDIETLFMNMIYLIERMKKDKLGGRDEINEPNPNAIISKHISYKELGNG